MANYLTKKKKEKKQKVLGASGRARSGKGVESGDAIRVPEGDGDGPRGQRDGDRSGLPERQELDGVLGGCRAPGALATCNIQHKHTTEASGKKGWCAFCSFPLFLYS